MSHPPIDTPCSTADLTLPPDAAPRLRNLTIELTERCQNACRHCYINRALDDPRRADELDTAAWQHLIRQAADLGTLEVRITGGEPLIRDDFAELYTFIRRQGMVVRLGTNARALTPALTDLFTRIPPLHKIEISVYGMSQATYEAVSGVAGSYAEFQRGVNLLLERNIAFAVSFVALPANRHEIPAFDAWTATLPAASGLSTVTTHLDLRVYRDTPRIDRRIAAMRMTPEDRVALLYRAPRYRNETRQFCRAFMGQAGDSLFNCGALTGGALDAYGFLLPCLSVRHPDFSIDTQQLPLRDALILQRRRLRALHASNPAYLQRCAQCFLHGLCEMCPGKAWTEHGTLDTPVEYFCALAHAQARDLGMLAPNERAWEVKNGDQRVDNISVEDNPA